MVQYKTYSWIISIYKREGIKVLRSQTSDNTFIDAYEDILHVYYLEEQIFKEITTDMLFVNEPWRVVVAFWCNGSERLFLSPSLDIVNNDGFVKEKLKINQDGLDKLRKMHSFFINEILPCRGGYIVSTT